jgi:prolyl-tRNA editing enzyme YbaK/EbsC (Cys-tRNA(Pro) deacylase)
VDESIAISEYIAFNAGTHQDVIRMSFSDFAALVNPLVAAFATPNSITSPSAVHAAK